MELGFLPIIIIALGLLYAYTEFRNLQLRAELGKYKIEHGLNTEVLKVTTATLRKQNEELARLKEQLKK